MPDVRLTLDREDFRRLVRGLAVRRRGVGIILSDIGFAVMAEELHEAIRATRSRLVAEQEIGEPQ